jgi:protein-disulfide isomerase
VTRVKQVLTATAGARYAGGTWGPVSALSNQFTFTPPTLHAGLDFKGYANTRLQLLMYGLAGPYAAFGPYLKLEANTSKTPWWELYGGLEVPVGVRVDLLGYKRIADYQVLAIGTKQLIAQAGTKPDVRVGVDADGNFYRGDPNATVRLVGFSDFQCPYSARYAVETGPLLDEAYVATGKVVYVFRNLPLWFHANAIPAAHAAYCAGQQNPKFFWELHGWLFVNQNTWATAQDAAGQFRNQAVALGVNGASYDACLQDAGTEAAMQRDIQEAVRLGIRGVPTFVFQKVNAQGQPEEVNRIEGAQPYSVFQQKIEALLAP